MAPVLFGSDFGLVAAWLGVGPVQCGRAVKRKVDVLILAEVADAVDSPCFHLQGVFQVARHAGTSRQVAIGRRYACSKLQSYGGTLRHLVIDAILVKLAGLVEVRTEGPGQPLCADRKLIRHGDRCRNELVILIQNALPFMGVIHPLFPIPAPHVAGDRFFFPRRVTHLGPVRLESNLDPDIRQERTPLHAAIEPSRFPGDSVFE